MSKLYQPYPKYATVSRELTASEYDTFYTTAQSKTAKAVNEYLVGAYWEIGKYIIEYEQKGSEKAEYGKKLLEDLSKDLSLVHGKGFSLSNIVGRNGMTAPNKERTLFPDNFLSVQNSPI